MSPVPPTVLRDSLAVIALAVIAWLELGWFVERADVTCGGRDDRSVTCTVTRHNRYRTREQSIAGVIGVTVRERENPMGSAGYELWVLTRSGSGGPLPTPRFHFRHSADREAERFTALVALAPGGAVHRADGPAAVDRSTRRAVVLHDADDGVRARLRLRGRGDRAG